jgi:hypothetical protein
LQIGISIWTGVHDPPKLSLSWRNTDLRPERCIHSERSFRFLRCGAALRGLHRDGVHHAFFFSGISGQNKIAQHQDPLAHV